MPAKKRKPARKAAPVKCESGRRYQDFIDGSPDIFWETDAEGRYTYVSAAAKAVLGYTPEELIGRTPFELMPPGEAERVGGLFAGFVARCATFSLLEHGALRKDGRELRLECSGNPLLDGRGRLKGYRGVDRDVTGRVAGALLDALPDIVFRIDRGGVWRYAHAPSGARFAAPLETFIGRSVAEVMPPDMVRSCMSALLKALDSGEVVFYEYDLPVPLPDGPKNRFEARIIPEGRDMALVIVRDLSAMARRSESFREAEMFRRIFESSSDAIIAYSPEMCYTLWNPAAERLLGVPAGKAVGAAIAELFPTLKSSKDWALIAGVFEGRSSVRSERPLPVKGREGYYDAVNVPLKDASGAIVGGLAILRDVTDSVLERRRLSESEARYRTLSDESADAVFLFDAEGRIRDANRTATTLLGFSRAELLSMTVPDLETRAPRERMLAAWAAMSPGDFRTFDGLCRRKGHAPFEVESRVACMAEGGERIFIGSVRDVSERREAARMLKVKDEQVRQAQRMESVGRLAGGIAHEFNNILAGIGGLAQLMKESLGPGRPESEDAQEIIAACGRAAGLVAQLLAFSRNRPPRRAPVDASVLFDRLSKVLRPAVDLKVSIKAVAAPGTPPMLADISQLEQALVNLCLNSADAIAGRGEIRVSAEAVAPSAPVELKSGTLAPGRWVRLRVADDGSGISPEHQTRVFEPFFTTKPVGQGTGLGLSVVYGIVSHHGGLVDLSSEGRGTAVDLYLPVAADAAGPSAPSGQARRLRGSETILVAEDDKALRSVVVRSLERLGYKVVVAKDGAEAVRLAKTHGPEVSLALLDVMMPKLEGYDAYEAIAPLNPRMRVLFMSGHSDAGSRPVAVGLPFIQKPFSPESLAARVREVLDG